MSSDDEGSDDNDKTYKIKDDEIEKNVRRSKRKRATNEKQKPQIRQTRSRTSRSSRSAIQLEEDKDDDEEDEDIEQKLEEKKDTENNESENKARIDDLWADFKRDIGNTTVTRSRCGSGDVKDSSIKVSFY